MQVCQTDKPFNRLESGADGLTVRDFGFSPSSPLPFQVEDDLWSLNGIGLGIGNRLSMIGKHMVPYRESYERELNRFSSDVSDRINRLRAQNLKGLQLHQEVESLARWTVNRRNQVIRQVRSRQFWDTRLSLIGRDLYVYKGSRTYEKIYAKQAKKLTAASSKPVSKLEVDGEIIRRSSKSNLKVSQTIEKGAKFLKHGGRVIWVFSTGTLAYELAVTPKRDLPKVIARETGGAAGGLAGSGIATGLCVAFGIATGGWGLLGCGVVGGLAGGMAGSSLAEGLFYTFEKPSNKDFDDFSRFTPQKMQRSLPYSR